MATSSVTNVIFQWLLLIFLQGTEDMQICQAQKRLAESWGWEMSKDEYEPLIHSLILASISLHLSAVRVPEDTEAWELLRKKQPFIFARLSHILPPCYGFLFFFLSLSPPHPLLSFSFTHFLCDSHLSRFALCVPLSGPVRLLKTVWRQCKSSAESRRRHWLACTPPPLVIGRRPQRNIQSAGWKCM